jgi:lysylphosphatidylglycerol synthetase-like protein (DUF2156 family)
MRWSHGRDAGTADDARPLHLRRRTAQEAELLAALWTRGDTPGLEPLEEPPRLERWDRVESRWNLGSVLVLLAGAALAVLGAVALARTGIDGTWFRPIEEVAGIHHTPLLAAIEAGVGLLLVIAGLAGAPGVAAFVSIAAAMAAGVAALEPERVAGQLATERWWLVGLAVGAAGLAVLSMVPWPRFVERHYTSEAASLSRPPRRRSTPRPGLVS